MTRWPAVREPADHGPAALSPADLDPADVEPEPGDTIPGIPNVRIAPTAGRQPGWSGGDQPRAGVPADARPAWLPAGDRRPRPADVPDARLPGGGPDARLPGESQPGENGSRQNRPSRLPVRERFATDPRLRAWRWRAPVSVIVFVALDLSLGWRLALTAAVVYLAADIFFRSKTTAVIPPEAMVTAAQRSTRHRLKVVAAAGYVTMNSRVIPDKDSVIDHLVVGPAGVFAIDSEKWDRRLPLRAIGGMLYHGPQSMEDRLAHARDEAHWAASLIGARLGVRIRIHPVMVIYGPKVPWLVMRIKGVDILGGNHVSAYFRKQSKATARHHLDQSHIESLVTAAERVLPPQPGASG